MKLSKELKALVITGAWNRNIFTKEWIANFLLPNDNFTVELPHSLQNVHRVSSEKLIIEFHDNKMVFIPKKNENDICSIISELAFKIADYLPHTPVFGYGVNFTFEYPNDDIKTEVITTKDSDTLAQNGAYNVTSKHSHKFNFEKVLINLEISIDSEQAFFNFNFHSDIDSLTQFKDKLHESPIDTLYDIALKIMNNVYLLDNEEGENNVK